MSMDTVNDLFDASRTIQRLSDERDNALELNRALERRVETQEQDLLAASTVIKSLCGNAQARNDFARATIQRLSEECAQLITENDRLRKLVKDFVRHNDRYPELYHPARAWAWVEEGNKLKEQARD